MAGPGKPSKTRKYQVIATPPAARKWRCVPARGRRLEGRHRASSRLSNRSTSPAFSHHTRDARRSRARTVSAEDGRGPEAAADRWHQRKVRGGGDGSISDAARSGSLELAPKTVTTSCSAAKVMSNTTLADGRRFGAIRLSRLNWEDIESLYAAMRASGRGPDWIRRCGTVLTRSLDLARKRGLIDSNPAKDAVRPKSTRKKPTSPLEDDVRAVLETVTARDPEMADMAVLLASTGMRTGEMLGLQWADVDLAAAEVHVAAAVTDGGPGVGVVRKATKRSDWRDVPLTGAAVAALTEAERQVPGSNLQSRPPRTAYLFGRTADCCQANATRCSEQTMDRRPRSFPDHSPRGSALCGNRNARRRGVVSHGCGDPR